MKARVRLQDMTAVVATQPSVEPNRTFSVDPGLLGTGWAEWHGEQLVRVGVITPPRAAQEPDWTARVRTVAKRLRYEVIQRGGIAHTGITVYCEMMEYQASAKRSVAWKRGDLQMTVYLIGYLAGFLWPCRFVPVPVRDWKGQLPKDVVERRIQETLGHEFCRKLKIHSHAWDAVGIGLYSLGIWK